MQSAEPLLWTAPEHLRDAFSSKSKKGDVYSFAIIVQEVVLEGPPFCGDDLELLADDIVLRVRSGERPAFRPTIPKGLNFLILRFGWQFQFYKFYKDKLCNQAGVTIY